MVWLSLLGVIHALQGCRFGSCSGHVPGCTVNPSPGWSSRQQIDVSLPPSLSLKIKEKCLFVLILTEGYVFIDFFKKIYLYF